MKVYWWQQGIHIEPESKEEYKVLIDITKVLVPNLKFADPEDEIPSGECDDSSDE